MPFHPSILKRILRKPMDLAGLKARATRASHYRAADDTAQMWHPADVGIPLMWASR